MNGFYIATMVILGFFAGVVVSLLVITVKMDKISYCTGREDGYNAGFDAGYERGQVV